MSPRAVTTAGFWLLTVAAALPFWGADLLALTDWPHHLVGAQIALDYGDTARHLQDYFRLDLTPRPYLGATYILMALAAVLPLQIAGKVLLSAYAVATCLAGRSLVSAAGRDPRLAWFAPLFVHQWALAYGFLPYILSLPFALFAIAWTRRWLDAPTRVGLARIFAAYALSALMHPLGLLLAAVATFGLLVVARAPWARWRSLGLAGAAVAIWGVLASSRVSREGVVFMDLGIETAWRWTIKHRLVDFALAYLPGDLDYAIAVVGIGALVAAVVMARKGRRDPLEGAALAIFALYLIAPVNLALLSLRMSLLAPRFIAPGWLLALVLVRGRVGHLAYAGGAAALAFSGLIANTHADFSGQWAPQVEAALAHVPADARIVPSVAGVHVSALNPKTVRPPEEALHAYAMQVAASDPRFFSVPQGPLHILAETSTRAPTHRWVQNRSTIRIVEAEGR